MAKRKARASRKKGTGKTAGRRAAVRRSTSTRRSQPRVGARRPAARNTITAKKARKTAKPTRHAAARTTKRPAARPKPPALQRERRKLPEDIVVPSPPSTLNFDRKASSAASGRASSRQHRLEHTEAGPELTAGDLDADWGEAYAEGDEAPGGDNPTPDQDVVEEIGRALGVEYEDAEELKGADKIIERDRHRWEYDPASADDYQDRNKKD